MDERRINHRLTAVVHYAQVLARESRSNAAYYLRRYDCPMDVAVRVLVGRSAGMWRCRDEFGK